MCHHHDNAEAPLSEESLDRLFGSAVAGLFMSRRRVAA